MNVLVVEDDQVIGKSLRRGLIESWHDCVWVKSGKKGLEQGLSQLFDAIVLDLLLPDSPGMEVLKQIRLAGLRTPILILTGLATLENRVSGLKAGADDYLVKPFDFSELMARLEALYRRTADRPSVLMSNGSIRLDLATQRAQKGDMEIDLTPTEAKILEILMRHAGNLVSCKTLSEHLWETDWIGATNIIQVHINRLRKKLDEDETSSIIRTQRGRGYALRIG